MTTCPFSGLTLGPQAMASYFQDFNISETTGFVLENPLTELPAYFDPWHRLAAEMPQRFENGTMRQETLKLELLDWTRLKGHRQKRLAHLQLALITAGYVWQDGEQGAAKMLPACVAIPLYGLSQDLGMGPTITHADLAHANYRLIDPAKPLEPENMNVLYYLPGGKEGEWFVVVTVAVEAAFAKGLKPVLAAMKGAMTGDEDMVTGSFRQLAEVVNDMLRMFAHMHKNLTADTFFNKFRILLGGWGGESKPLPDGLIYEGVSEQPLTALGASAAQSATIPVLDALLGIQHTPERESLLLKMRGYMLPDHQRFIVCVEKHSHKLQNMIKSTANEELKLAHNSLLSAIANFRSYHIQIVTKYIVQAASQAELERNEFKSLNSKGTGGSDLLPFLKDLRRDTTDRMIMTSATPQGTS